MTALRPYAAALSLFAFGCASAPPKASARADRVAEVARVVVVDGCARAADGKLGEIVVVPAWRSARPSFDVVVYTAHPDDEAMYAGGTMDRLVRAGHRVTFVSMSHGEGGRLLERRPDGTVDERRDYPRSHVVEVRDREIAEAAKRVGVAYAHLHSADANADDAWTTSCAEALAHWDAGLPGGVEGTLRRLVADIRARRPRVVITLDPRDDPQSSHHGHHKAVGVLVDVAARLAADPAVLGGEPHVVEELLTTAPQGAPADVSVPVDVATRIRMLEAYASQFLPEKLAVDPVAQRASDDFVLRWRATGAPPTEHAARLLDLVAGAPR